MNIWSSPKTCQIDTILIPVLQFHRHTHFVCFSIFSRHIFNGTSIPSTNVWLTFNYILDYLKNKFSTSMILHLLIFLNFWSLAGSYGWRWLGSLFSGTWDWIEECPRCETTLPNDRTWYFGSSWTSGRDARWIKWKTNPTKERVGENQQPTNHNNVIVFNNNFIFDKKSHWRK